MIGKINTFEIALAGLAAFAGVAFAVDEVSSTGGWFAVAAGGLVLVRGYIAGFFK